MKNILLCVSISLLDFNIQSKESDLYHTYMWAHFNDLQGKPKIAQKYYSKLFDTGAPTHAYQAYIHHLASTQQYGLIVRLIPQLDTLFANNHQIQIIFIKALEQQQKYKEAEKRLFALQEKHKDDGEITHAVIQSLLNKQQFAQAIKIIDEFIKQNPSKQHVFLFYYIKAQIYANLRNTPLAVDNIKKCMELKPNFDQGWLLFGMIHELEGNINDALKGYNNAVELNGSNPMIEQHIFALTLKQQANTAHNDFSKAYNHALGYFKHKEYAQALTAINSALKTAPQQQSARLLKIEILINLKEIDTGLQLLKDWIIQKPTDEIYYKSLHLLYQANIAPEKIITTLYDLEGIIPHNVLVLKYLADLYLKQNNQEKALEYLKKTLAQTKDTTLKTKIYYQMALLYHDLENNAGMEQALQAGYKINNTFAPLNNLLAYHYAHTGKHQDAEKIIKTVIEQTKDNQVYQDTYGYILYKKREYQHAATVLHTSIEKNGDHCCSFMHLSQVYAKLNKKEKAQEFLDKAAQFAHTDKEKNKIAKIKDKLKISS